MAVPKKRTSVSKKGTRRSHHALSPETLIKTPDGTLLPRRLKKAYELGLTKFIRGIKK